MPAPESTDAPATPATPAPQQRPEAIQAQRRAELKAAVMARSAQAQPPPAAAPTPAPTPAAAPAIAPPEPAAAPEPAGIEYERRVERAVRERIDRERAQMAAEWHAEREGLTSSNGKLQRELDAWAQAGADPDELVRRLGLQPDGVEALSRALWGMTPEGQKTPAAAAAAREKLRENKARAAERGEVAKLREELDGLKREREEQAKQAQHDANIRRYLSGFTDDMVNADPIVKARAGSDNDGLAHELLAVAEDLYGRTHSVPSHADVMTEYKRRRRAQLERLRAEFDALASAAPEPAAPAPHHRPEPAPAGGRLSRAQLVAGIQQLRPV